MEKMQEEKKVDYIELFFDLIFVYTFRTVNALVTHGDRFVLLSSACSIAELVSDYDVLQPFRKKIFSGLRESSSEYVLSFLYGNQHGESVFGALYTLSSRLCCGFFQFGTPLLSPK